MSKGVFIVLSGPSGSGKDSLLALLTQKDENIRLSVSATTRQPRDYEKNGVDYHFVSREKFVEMIDKDEVFEYAEYCGNFYGTPKAAILDWIGRNNDVILEIEVVGAAKVKKLNPDAVGIFIMPPSLCELERRLRERGSSNEEDIQKRLRTAMTEMKCAYDYDYIVVNDKINEAVETIRAIIAAEKAKKKNMTKFIEGVVSNA